MDMRQVRLGRSASVLAGSTVASGSEASRAVDDLADQVGVPVVPCVLLHEVLPHPAHRDGLLAQGECVVQVRALERGIDGPALSPVALKVLLGYGWAGLFEVRVRGNGAVIQVGHLLTPVGLPDPPALGVAHVPDQPEQREVRRWHGAYGQLSGVQARAFAQQGGPVPVEPVAEHFLLGFVAALRIVLRALDVGCDPGHCSSLCRRLNWPPTSMGYRHPGVGRWPERAHGCTSTDALTWRNAPAA